MIDSTKVIDQLRARNIAPDDLIRALGMTVEELEPGEWNLCKELWKNQSRTFPVVVLNDDRRSVEGGVGYAAFCRTGRDVVKERIDARLPHVGIAL